MSVPAAVVQAVDTAGRAVMFAGTAIYRWERATMIDPTYAAAHNNLAIAYEHEGELDKARAAYEKALELAPDNAFIKQNYELFKEINDRTARENT